MVSISPKLSKTHGTDIALQNSPAAIVRIVITGSQILGRAFLEAGRQAVKSALLRRYNVYLLTTYSIDAKQNPGVASDVTGVRGATSGSLTDKLTVEHRMTVDEAHLILNTKQTDTMEAIMKVRNLH